MELWELTLQQMIGQLNSRCISSAELAESVYEHTEKTDKAVKAFITLADKDKIMEQARLCDTEAFRGIKGIPYGLKDIFCTRGLKTTCASHILDNFIPPYNATVVNKLNEQQGIILGKLNMDEFAMGSSTEQSAFFPTHNPWDLERVPGGSSGGSAAAVAAGEIPFSLGTDTGGSIRQPAAYCGVVGLKPTYGRVSRWGVIAFASSLDQVGVFSKTVTDCAIVMNIIAGHDPLDSTSVNIERPDYTRFLNADIKGLRIGVPKEYFQQGIQAGVKEEVKKALKFYESSGALVEEISLPHTEYALPAYYLVAPAEASANLARFDGVRYGWRNTGKDNILDMYSHTRAEGFGDEVKRRIMLGTYALSSGYYDAYYLKALKVRTLIYQDFMKAFENLDVIISPTTPSTAFKIGEQIGDPLTLYLNDILTVPVNMAGLPGISIPCGLSDGLPVGMQIIGKAFDEGTILKTAYAFEQNSGFHIKLPHPEVI
ncbi:MAG: Asp-tRNA(Asn)/Glu-tRNA(Gln) amidotransferase subunit GatA [Syntrophomonadaceae bacterium]|jgi:aspartyl-tRNA(Asn)/glutamyl-tRNA(Gln) amidotransferase subunit A|nr:Asp-tRNA(Asn)/Glu-tRNA(Gln) amidotransferase subunit GatA [Syntrophomonadaceae bacterium]